MRHTRATRVARGAAAATVATFVALLSHVAGGAAMPGWLGVLAPWVLSLFVCVLLAGRSLSLPRLSIAVAISQFLFHTLFILGTGGTALAGGGHVHGQLTFVADASGTATAIVADPAMWLWHGIAAVTTIAALHRGEQSLRHLLDLAASGHARLVAFVAAIIVIPVSPPRRRPLTPTTAAVVTAVRTVFLSAVVRRGPPVLPVH